MENQVLFIEIVKNFKKIYQNKLKDYNANNIYNCDETGLFWKQSVNKTIVLNESDKASGKYSKERITILFCVNMIGEKLSSLIIGKAKLPHSYKSKNIH